MPSKYTTMSNVRYDENICYDVGWGCQISHKKKWTKVYGSMLLALREGGWVGGCPMSRKIVLRNTWPHNEQGSVISDYLVNNVL